MSNFICPVCSREASSLEEVRKCIDKHIDVQNAQKQAEKEKEINFLKQRNKELYDEIKKNSVKLNELGVKVKTSYSIEDNSKIEKEVKKKGEKTKVSLDELPTLEEIFNEIFNETFNTK